MFNYRYKSNLLESELASILISQNGNCAICSSPLELWHIDHIIPVSLKGHSKISNLQILCESCNVGKYRYSQIDYIQHCAKVILSQIKKGDTPKTNNAAKLAHEWISQWLETMQGAFAK